jgi:hypothetical protein
MVEAARAGSWQEKRTAVVKLPKAVDREFLFKPDPDRVGARPASRKDGLSAVSRAEVISRPDTQSVS